VAIGGWVILQLVGMQNSDRPNKLRAIVMNFTLPFLMLIFWILTLKQVGLWSGFNGWVLSLKNVAQYMAVPSDINAALKSPFNLFGFYLVFFFTGLAWGSFRVL
jgi:hypothetical protein